MLGGWVEINPESADVQDAAQHVVRTINSKAKYKKMFKLILVSSAKRQVCSIVYKENEVVSQSIIGRLPVADCFQVTNAINFKVDMVLGRTKCLNSGNHDLNNCTLTKRVNPSECDSFFQLFEHIVF